MITEMTSELPTRPATKAAGGRGVPRTRLSWPASRSAGRLVASLTVVAEITASVRIAGT